MSTDVLAALRAANKFHKEAMSKLKELDPEFKLSIGVYTIKHKNFALKVINDNPVIEIELLIMKSATGEYDGFSKNFLLWLNSGFGISKALSYLTTLGVKSVDQRYAKDQNEAFVSFVNDANKIKDEFAIELTYNKAGYANFSLLRKVNSSKIEEVPTESPVEEIPQGSPIEDLPETEEEIIDDFAEDDIITEEEIPEIPELQSKTVSTGAFEKYKKQLQMFLFTMDIEVEDMKNQPAEVLVQAIETQVPEGFNIKDLEKKDVTMLKKVGLEKLLK